jgi:hypothetical protein
MLGIIVFCSIAAGTLVVNVIGFGLSAKRSGHIAVLIVQIFLLVVMVCQFWLNRQAINDLRGFFLGMMGGSAL